MPTDLPEWVLQRRRQFGRQMRAIRTERGLTQERLALETGLNRHTVYRIELGTHAGSVDAVLLIAAALGVPPARLFQDE